MKNTIVFYHGRCVDGFGAAFAAWLKLGKSAQYVACHYGDVVPPSVKGKRVYILDFSFEWDVMERMSEEASELIMLDHHATAQKKLHGFSCRCGKVLFDLNRSGAVLAWEHFHPDVPAPKFFKYIQDRDLWKWELPETANFLSALDALEFDFQQWKRVLDMDNTKTNAFIARGRAMNDKYQALCDSIAKKAAKVELLGVKGLMVNASSEFTSDVGARLAKRSGTFGLIWALDDKGVVKVSLRSVPEFDASKIAESFGGGGHPAACAFLIPLEKLSDLVKGTLRP